MGEREGVIVWRLRVWGWRGCECGSRSGEGRDSVEIGDLGSAEADVCHRGADLSEALHMHTLHNPQCYQLLVLYCLARVANSHK